MDRRLRVGLALWSAAVVACLTAVPVLARADVGQQPTYDLSANWLDGAPSLDLAHLNRLVELSASDPQAASAVSSAESVLGVSGAEGLLPYIKIMKNIDTGPSASGAVGATTHVFIEGVANVSPYIFEDPKLLGELIGQGTPDHRAALEAKVKPGASMISYEDGPDNVVANYVARDGICLAQEQDLLMAYGTFIHELTHIAQLVPKLDLDTFLDEYASADDFTRAMIAQPGDELDANSAGYGAMIRAAGGRWFLPPALAACFDNAGHVVDRDGLTTYLLTQAGYNQFFRKRYSAQLTTNYNLLVQEEQLLAREYADRSQGLQPYAPDNVHEIAAESQDRIQSDLTRVRDLEERYLQRMAAEHAAEQNFRPTF